MMHRLVMPRGFAIALAAYLALSFGDGGSALAQTAQPTPVAIDATKPWTDTGITVRAGESVTVSVKGKVHFGPGQLDAMPPVGIPQGARCDELAQVTGFWTVRTLPCWSAIARVGNGTAIAIGAGTTFKAPANGRLQLGVNDNRFVDNSGSWTASVRVTPVGVAPVAPVATAHGGNGTGDLAWIIAAIGAVGLIALCVLLFRRPRLTDETDDEPALAPAPAKVPALVGGPTGNGADPVPSDRLEPTRGQQTVVPGAGESVDVNIFEVDIVDRAALRVGYNYFPERTLVRWRIVQDGIPKAVGEFVTEGGGSTYHFVTMPLDVVLAPEIGGTEVHFAWVVGGVPFEYSVLGQQTS